ncbi:hypothetical protein MVEN_01036300 [Mycena venus]|uniref:Uncharacterized protein n=1 Tax=Mycena venus TaxID=2733690 RepID=A0A8H7D2H0_9AGAR|nr:hypothetical protein MVEN_01036300 [Mycena venus]
MSHVRQARAHLRHANRAGGFGSFGGSNNDPLTDFFPPTFTFPGVGETKTKTSETSESTDSAAPTSSAPVTDASAAADSTSSASVAETSSNSTTSAIPTTTTTTSTTTTPITHSSIPITTTASGTALHDNLTKVVTHVASVTAQAAAANSSNPAAPATSNALVAPVIGGVAGGIVGLALLIFLVTWFMRRRRPDQDAINFDPGSFRRSAMMITEPPTHQDTVDRGYNPATPPAMVERRPIYTQASFDNHVGISSPNSGSQLVFQAPFSPITNGPNVTSPVSAYDHHSWGAPAPAPCPGPDAQHLRLGQPQYAAYPVLPSRQNSMRNGQLAPPHNETEYVDLERTSVTPFQAEQYVEISKQLNTEVPKGLDTPTVSQIVAQKMDLPPLPPPEKENPFADSHDEGQEEGNSTLAMVQDMSFPRAALARAHLLLALRPVTSAYLSDGASSTPGSQTVFMKGPFAESPMGSRFPVTPSPLASSFTVPTPPPAKANFDAPAEPEPAANTQSQARPEPKKRQTVYSTVYDPEDAYGGF